MVREFASLALGLLIAWGIIAFVPVRKQVSTFTSLQPWPLELDDSNLMLIGVGLASQKPSKPSVMDTSPAPAPKTVAIMTPASASPTPHMAHATSPMPMAMASAPSPIAMSPSPAPVAMAPTPVSMMSPAPLTIVPSPSS